MDADPMTHEEIEEALRSGIKNAVAKGVQLVRGCYRGFNSDGAVITCCAVGAYLLDCPRDLASHQYEAMVRFGISGGAVSLITRGWDDDTLIEESPYWDIGVRLRKEFLPK